MASCSLRRFVLICLVLWVMIDASCAQQVRRRRPHYPRFEILWPLHWVSAAYFWGFLKMGAIFAGLMLLFVVRALPWWSSGPTVFSHEAPIYHYRGFGSASTEELNSESVLNDALYWTDKIDKLSKMFEEDVKIK